MRSTSGPFPSVVCAVPATDRDDVLVGVAAALATRTGMALELFHVHEPVEAVAAPGIVAHAPLVPPPPRDVAESRARLRSLAGDAGHPSARCDVTDGPAARLLEAVSRRPDVAWLVIGDHGGGPLRAALEANLARILLTSAHCPLLVVPRHGDARAIEDAHAILCAVADDGAAPAAVAAAATLAGDFDVPLTIVHAMDAPYPGRVRRQAKRVAPLLDRCVSLVPASIEAEGMSVAGPPAESVLEVANERDARIVVAGGPHHGLLRSALGGSLVHELLGRVESMLTVVVPSDPATNPRRPAHARA
jgi:nucleotide-binding universal stress UspA family protein